MTKVVIGTKLHKLMDRAKRLKPTRERDDLIKKIKRSITTISIHKESANSILLYNYCDKEFQKLSAKEKADANE